MTSSIYPFSSVAQSCLTLFNPMNCSTPAFLSITNSRSLLKLMSIMSIMPSNNFILYSPLLLSPSIFPSIRIFSNKSVLCIRWSKYWRFSFNMSPSHDYSGLISFRIDWLISLESKGRVFNTTVLLCSAFFMVQLSHPYMTTGKNIALTRWTFVSKVTSLFFNMLPRFVIAWNEYLSDFGSFLFVN